MVYLLKMVIFHGKLLVITAMGKIMGFNPQMGSIWIMDHGTAIIISYMDYG
jgi:hypothetical protein